MTVVNFPTADALAVYVNDNTIAQASIVAIEVKDGRWYLFHF